MHLEVEQFIEKVRWMHKEHFIGKRVLEVGSLDINGSVRKYFEKCEYTGIDLGLGPGVDLVCKGHEHKKPQHYNTVISTEMLEHDAHWVSSLLNMHTNLKGGGMLIVTCAAPGRKEHGTKRTSPSDSPFTPDHYRNISISDFQDVLMPCLFLEYHIEYQRGDKDLFFYGIKNK
jgi:hypothetical protein